MPSTANVTLCDDVQSSDRFEQVACWRGHDTREILDVEATRSSDAVFLVTHHPVPMRRFEDFDASGAERPYSQEQFLEDFLDPEESYRFVPILGTTGVGKSHLVRWLDVKIREQTSDDTRRRVLLIEKAGATLREVLRRILALDVAQGEQFDEYREKLEEAGQDLSESELKDRIRYELKVAVENYDPEPGENDGGGTGSLEHRRYIAQILPPFIEDPYFRDDWLEEEGVIDETFRTSFQEGRSQEPPSFSKDTLPLGESLTDVRKKAPSSLDAYQKLTGNRQHLDAALHVLDECLGAAVRQVLNFKGNDLLELMNEVRREFARRDVELVLLIEDIAAVQGLDRQLLASVERSEEEFGVLRTAMGCTEGHYQEKIMKTTKERASFHLNLNVEDREAADIDLATFASRYLNAIRLGEEQLDAIVEEGEEVPSACEACAFKKQCHEAFGKRENRGLYPFTEEALHTLYEGVTDQAFNPRKLIMRVLRYVLVTYTDDLRNGTFPPDGVRQQFRRNQDLNVDPVTKQAWRRDDPDHADQRILVADTWGHLEDGKDLSVDVFRAFGIDAEGGEVPEDEEDTGEYDPSDDGTEDTETEDTETAGSGADETETEDDQITGDGAPPPPELSLTEAERRLQKKEEQLGKWANRFPLPQTAVQHLRKLVHSSVVSWIDWDGEGLSQKFFSGRTRTEFCNSSIDFDGGGMQQDVQSKGRRIQLRLPLDAQTADDVQIALVGLLRARHHGHWRFEKGRDYLLQASECLDTWAEHILNRLRRPSRDRPPWDPAPAAAELLAVRARLGGADLGPDVPLSDRVDALFRSYEFITEGRGRAWSRLVEGLEKGMRHGDDEDGLVEILEAHAWLRKGKKATTRIYDLAQFESVLSSLDEHGALQAPFNASSKAELRKSYDPLWEARDHVEKYLQRAVEDEVSTLQSWKADVEEAFEPTDDLASQVDRVDDALFGLMNVDQRGILQSREMKQYESLSESMREEETQQTVDAVDECLAAWGESDVPGPVLMRLAADRDRRLKIVSSYVELADTLLDKAHGGLQSDVDVIESGEGGLTATYDLIRSNLDELAETLTTIRETDGVADE